MSLEEGGLFLILAASQRPTLVILGGALRRHDLTRPARQVIRFSTAVWGFMILSILVLWLNRLAPISILLGSARPALIVMIVALILMILLRTLIMILSGAFRLVDSASSRSDR